MFVTIKNLRRCTVCGTDGAAGGVSDVLFDDAAWRVRYVVAETGSWLHSHRVLLPPEVLGHVRGDERTLPVALTDDEIECERPLDADPPVSMRMEQQIRNVVALASCWVAGFCEPNPANPLMVLTTAVPAWSEALKPRPGDPHLRSASRVIGHHAMAQDGMFGCIEDFVVDDDGWSVRDLVVQAGGFFHHKRLLVSPSSVSRISWGMRAVRIELPRARIEGGPTSARCA